MNGLNFITAAQTETFMTEIATNLSLNCKVNKRLHRVMSHSLDRNPRHPEEMTESAGNEGLRRPGVVNL